MARMGRLGRADVDPRFESDVLKYPVKLNVDACLQCGVCGGSCPVAFSMDYTPRELVELVKLGLKEKALSCRAIWICTGCNVCSDRCPEDVNPSEVLNSLRALAFKSGFKVPEMFLKMMENLLSYGWIYEVDEFTNEDRADRGLPQLKPPSLDSLKKMMEATWPRGD